MEALKYIAFALLGFYLLGVDETVSGPLAGICFLLMGALWLFEKERQHHRHI